MIGTVYIHTDISANLSALHEVRGWADEGRISNARAHEILESNSQAFDGSGARRSKRSTCSKRSSHLSAELLIDSEGGAWRRRRK